MPTPTFVFWLLLKAPIITKQGCIWALNNSSLKDAFIDLIGPKNQIEFCFSNWIVNKSFRLVCRKIAQCWQLWQDEVKIDKKISLKNKGAEEKNNSKHDSFEMSIEKFKNHSPHKEPTPAYSSKGARWNAFWEKNWPHLGQCIKLTI